MNVLQILIDQLRVVSELGYQTKCHIGNVGEAFAVHVLGGVKMLADNKGHDVIYHKDKIYTTSVKTIYMRANNFHVQGIKPNENIDELLVVVLDPQTHRPLQYLQIPYEQAILDTPSKSKTLSLGRYRNLWIKCN
jgi:hypothetical protein